MEYLQRKILALIFVLTVFSTTAAQAQITVAVADLTGSVGETVEIPVTIGDVPQDGFNSFQFDVTPSNGNVVFLGHVAAGTLSASNGWSVLSNSGTAQNNPGRVGGFSSSNDAVKVSGVLIYLRFEIQSVGSNTLVTLENMRFAKGATVSHTPLIPSTVLAVAALPTANDDLYTVSEGERIDIDGTNGVLANDAVSDVGSSTSAVATSPSHGLLQLSADGSFSYQHDGSETTTDSFSYTVTNEAGSDTGTATITIIPVNDAPQFALAMTDQAIGEGDQVTGQFTATDAEGDAITYSILAGPVGSTVNATSGLFAYTAPVGSSGVYTVTISASDGNASSTASFVLTIRNVEQYATVLSGIHQPVVNSSAASGNVEVTYDASSHDLVLSGSFSALGSFMASAQLMMGSSSQAGTGVFNLTASLSGSGMSGTFTAASNTFDLDTAILPAGVTLTMVENALRAGELFVNVRTLDRLDGELRGNLLPMSNGAPTAVVVSAPSSVTVTGEPSSQAYSLTWTPGSDPDGHATKLVLDASGDILFSNYQSVTDVTAAAGSTVSVTVAEAAALFDALSGASAGSIPVGSTEIVYYRLRHTDGAVLSIGNSANIVLTRGTVTDTEDASLPSDFVLKGNYPNPFNPSTTISFDLPETADVQVDVMDLLGRTMISVPSQSLGAGVNRSISIDASELTSGIYMYRVLVRGVSQTWLKSGTMTLIK